MVKNKIRCLLEVHSTPMTQSVCLPTHLLDFSLHNYEDYWNYYLFITAERQKAESA